MRIGGKEVVVLADFMRVFVGEKMEASAHPELPSPPPIVAPSSVRERRARERFVHSFSDCNSDARQSEPSALP